MKLRLECTCESCPEQYDVYLDKEIVGYIRIRWDVMLVYCPDVHGGSVYHHIEHDGMLEEAQVAILEWVKDRTVNPYGRPGNYEDSRGNEQ